jgi:hypothetical protein
MDIKIIKDKVDECIIAAVTAQRDTAKVAVFRLASPTRTGARLRLFGKYNLHG